MEYISRAIVKRQYGTGGRKASRPMKEEGSTEREVALRSSPRRSSVSHMTSKFRLSSPLRSPGRFSRNIRADSLLPSSSASEWSDVLEDQDYRRSTLLASDLDSISSMVVKETQAADGTPLNGKQQQSPNKLTKAKGQVVETETPPTSSPPPSKPSSPLPRISQALIPTSDHKRLNRDSSSPSSASFPSSSSQEKSNGFHSFFQRVEQPRKRQKVNTVDSKSKVISYAVQGSSVATRNKPPSSRPHLEQLYLDPFDTPGHSTLSCSTCSMSYARTPEDMALHAKHHKRVVGGIDFVLPKTDESIKGVTVINDGLEWGSTERGGKILMIEGSCLIGPLGRKMTDILTTVDTELSSSTLTPEQLAQSKIFLFVTLRRKVIACAVVQRIEAAYVVVRGLGASTTTSSSDVRDDDHDSHDAHFNQTGLVRFGESEGAVFCSSRALPTLLGVHRIWTCSTYRRQGLASQLLDSAAERFIYGCPINKGRRAQDVAFSQPTGAGMGLARKWTGTSEYRVFSD